MDSNNYPSNWTVARLENVCEILDSKRIPVNNSERNERIAGENESELYPYYGATGQVGLIDDFIFEGEHVLVGEDGAPFLDPTKQKAYIVNGRFWVNNHAHILLAHTSNKFLCHYLNLFNYSDFVTGTTRLKLNQALLKNIPVPLPPLNEQKRIVAKIEELFSELDNGIVALKTAREQLKVYRQAVLKHAFEGKLTAQWREENKDKLESPEQLLTRIQQEREARYQQQLEEWKAAVKAWEANGKDGKKPGKPKKYKPTPLIKELAESNPTIPNSWKRVSFSELLFSIRGGTTVPPIDTPTELPILRSSSIRAWRLNLEDIRYLPEDSKISDDDYLNFSDLLFSRLNGTLEFVGVCASVPSVIPQNLLYPDRLYCAKLIDADMAKFCEYYFSNPVVRRNIEKKAKSTAGHKRISIPDVSEQPIPILDKAEIGELVNSLSEKFSFVDKLQEEIEKSLSESETLRQSILKKAFSGQLVPQDPNDEPASELLARIQAEKTAEKAKQKASAKPKAAGKPGTRPSRKPKATA
ncbi:MAG: restriction endonuclease subunit S [Enterobacteriaceae bacterium]